MQKNAPVGRACILLPMIVPLLFTALSAHGVSTWSRTYGRDYADSGNSVQQTVDGGHIVAGYTTEVAPDAVITVTFDQEMDNALIESTTMIVAGSNSGIIMGAQTEADTTVHYDPLTGLPTPVETVESEPTLYDPITGEPINSQVSAPHANKRTSQPKPSLKRWNLGGGLAFGSHLRNNGVSLMASHHFPRDVSIFSIVPVYPVIVIGTSSGELWSPHGLCNESFNLTYALIDGRAKIGLPNFGMSFSLGIGVTRYTSKWVGGDCTGSSTGAGLIVSTGAQVYADNFSIELRGNPLPNRGPNTNDPLWVVGVSVALGKSN